MMFASKTPRELNRDPKPWQCNQGDRYALPQDCGREGAEVVHDPRPEYDHPQNNEPNPILVAFRGKISAGLSTREHALDALAAVEMGSRPYMQQIVDRDGIDLAVNFAHIDHARRVLTRLATLAEQENTAC